MNFILLFYYAKHWPNSKKTLPSPRPPTYKNKKGEEQQMKINVIPTNMEKYTALMSGKHLIFLDSFQFMSSRLDKLVSDLPDKGFKYISKAFKNEQFKLMKQKGVYPYDYMSSFDKLNEKQLPKKVFTAY